LSPDILAIGYSFGVSPLSLVSSLWSLVFLSGLSSDRRLVTSDSQL